MVAPQYLEALNYVLWDIENGGLPRRCQPATVHGKIMTWLRNMGYIGDITIVAVVANAGRLDPNVFQVLRDNHVEVIVLDSEEKEAADDRIRELIGAWTFDNLPPANIVLISGDGGFSFVLHSLAGRQYNVILANIKASASKKLKHIGTARGV